MAARPCITRPEGQPLLGSGWMPHAGLAFPFLSFFLFANIWEFFHMPFFFNDSHFK